METNTFYLVWSPDTGYAKQQHRLRVNAMDEARRLARVNQDRSFYVLRAMTGICVVKPISLLEMAYD